MNFEYHDLLALIASERVVPRQVGKRTFGTAFKRAKLTLLILKSIIHPDNVLQHLSTFASEAGETIGANPILGHKVGSVAQSYDTWRWAVFVQRGEEKRKEILRGKKIGNAFTN
eukprot:832331-Pelagomonas_calceolata.AAC.2